MNYEMIQKKQSSHMYDLNDAELNQISGGNVLVVAAAATAVFTALNAAESFGQKLGKALYKATH